MKSFVSTALLGAAGLLALSLSAHAAGSTSVTDPAVIKSAQSTQYMQLARQENWDSGGNYKKSKKKKKSS
jgi:hypothetical protein